LEKHGSSRSTRSSRLARLARQSRTCRVESSRAKWNLSLTRSSSGRHSNNTVNNTVKTVSIIEQFHLRFFKSCGQYKKSRHRSETRPTFRLLSHLNRSFQNNFQRCTARFLRPSADRMLGAALILLLLTQNRHLNRMNLIPRLHRST